MLRIEHMGRAISEEEVVDLEKRIGCRLPEPYRRFLLKNNGGTPAPDMDTIDIEHMAGSPTDVDVFFGIDRTIKSSTIEWNMSALEGRIANHLLPIASDSGGNIFCVSLSQPDFGAVVYCDFNPTWHLGGAVYYSVAPDFDDFLKKSEHLKPIRTPSFQSHPAPETVDLSCLPTVPVQVGTYDGLVFSTGTDEILDEMVSDGPDKYWIVLWRGGVMDNVFDSNAQHVRVQIRRQPSPLR
jgi:hypothetical protein